MNVYVSLLCNLVLCDNIKVSKTFMQEGGDIVSFLKDLRINIVIYER